MEGGRGRRGEAGSRSPAWGACPVATTFFAPRPCPASPPSPPITTHTHVPPTQIHPDQGWLSMFLGALARAGAGTASLALPPPTPPRRFVKAATLNALAKVSVGGVRGKEGVGCRWLERGAGGSKLRAPTGGDEPSPLTLFPPHRHTGWRRPRPPPQRRVRRVPGLPGRARPPLPPALHPRLLRRVRRALASGTRHLPHVQVGVLARRHGGGERVVNEKPCLAPAFLLCVSRGGERASRPPLTCTLFSVCAALLPSPDDKHELTLSFFFLFTMS